MWSVPGPSGQPYIMLNPHLGFYACCPTLLAFGYPISLLVFFLIFFPLPLTTLLWTSICLPNCLCINSMYGEQLGWCSSFRCWMWRWQIHVCPSRFYPSLCNHTDLGTISEDVWGKSSMTWSMVQPQHIELQSLSFSPWSCLLLVVTLTGFGTLIFFLGNKRIFSTSNT